MTAAPRLLALALVAGALAAAAVRDEPRGWLGVSLGDDHAPGTSAARIERVLPESPAARAGLLAGEIVRRTDTRTIRGAHDLTDAVRRARPGTVMTLGLERGGVPLEVTVTIAARPPDVYRLLEDDRDPWQDPARVLALLAVGPGSAVADVGAGGGYFTERLAALVGPTGRVVAVDIDPEALQQLTTRFASTPGVVVRRGRPTDPDLEPASLDAVLLVDAFHELQAPEAMLTALRRALRVGGRLVIVDRPATEYVPGTHAIPEARVVSEADAAGFRVRERADLPRQFAVVLE
jgi:predicted methyltransferase